MYLKQSTSVDVPIGPFLDETDGKTAETALTITQPDIRLKKNGGAWAQKAAAQTLAHEEAGWYEVTLDATDTDTIGHLVVAIHESGALPVWREFHILAANVYDSLFGAATDKLDVNTVEWLGTAAATPTVGGVPEVDVTHWIGTAAATPTVAGVPEVDLTHVAGATTNVAALATNVDAILTDTAVIGAAGAGLTSVRLADGAHGGLGAVLTLERIVVASTSPGEPGIKVTGNTSGAGMRLIGGSSGHGLRVEGTAGGAGLSAVGGALGNGVQATGGVTGPTAGIAAIGVGAGQGLYCEGGATGDGLKAVGGVTSGSGLRAEGITNSDGITAVKAGTGVDIRGNITGNVTGNVSGSVGSVASGGIVAASFGAGAIDNAAFNVTETLTANPAAGGISAASFAAGAIDATAIATGAIDADAIAADAITAAKIANGAIDAATFAAGAIDAAAIADNAIDRATFAADTGLQSIRSNTAQAGSGTTLTLDAGASATDEFYQYAWLYLTGGLGAGQIRRITGYVGSTKVATVATWAVTPDVTTTFAVFGRGTVRADGVANGGIVAASFASGAIDAVAIADGAIDAATFAAGAINAAAIAADAIGASELAADAVTEIQAGLSTLTLAQLRTALGTNSSDVIAELAQAAPSATPSVGAALMLLYMALRNLHTSTATVESITNDAGTVICKATLSDDATTFSKAELVTGP